MFITSFFGLLINACVWFFIIICFTGTFAMFATYNANKRKNNKMIDNVCRVIGYFIEKDGCFGHRYYDGYLKVEHKVKGLNYQGSILVYENDWRDYEYISVLLNNEFGKIRECMYNSDDPNEVTFGRYRVNLFLKLGILFALLLSLSLGLWIFFFFFFIDFYQKFY